MSTRPHALFDAPDGHIRGTQPQINEMHLVSASLQSADPRRVRAAREGTLESEARPRSREFAQTLDHDPPGPESDASRRESQQAERDGVRVHEFQKTERVFEQIRSERGFARAIRTADDHDLRIHDAHFPMLTVEGLRNNEALIAPRASSSSRPSGRGFRTRRVRRSMKR
jgi:hypothetical protein